MIDRIMTVAKAQWKSGLLSGSALLFLSMTLVNGGNYIFNLILGRWLGPADFADVTLIVTLLLMARFITVAFQMTSVKFTAAFAAENDTTRMAALARWVRKQSWIWGVAAGLVVAGGAVLWQRFFHTASAWPFVILGIGLPVYLVQGTDRGILQGQLKFGRLSASYQAEMWVRLLASILLVWLGLGVNGAVWAVTLSFVATWLIARKIGPWAKEPGTLSESERNMVVRYAGPVVLVYLGQILINNSDILLVKRFFDSATAGHYSALALIGRIVFFATWSVVAVIFPMVAQREQRGESHRHLLWAGLGLVGLVSAGIIAASWAFPQLIIRSLFGDAYLDIAPMLWLYGLATGLYAMANVVVNYRLSAGNKAGTWFTLAAGAAQVVFIILFHETLLQVVMVQVVLMGALFATLMVWDQWLVRSGRRGIAVDGSTTAPAAVPSGARLGEPAGQQAAA